MRYYMIHGLSVRDIMVVSHGANPPVPVPDRPADFALQITPNPDYHRENLGHYLGNFAIVRYDSNRILCRVDDNGIAHAWYIENA